jgi:hypothetical protein
MSGHTARVFSYPIKATRLPEPEPEMDHQP